MRASCKSEDLSEPQCLQPKKQDDDLYPAELEGGGGLNEPSANEEELRSEVVLLVGYTPPSVPSQSPHSRNDPPSPGIRLTWLSTTGRSKSPPTGMMSREPQPRRTAEKRFSTTAVQAIHQQPTEGSGQGGRMAGRRGEARRPAPAPLCSHLRAYLGVSARPYSAWAANPGRCRSAPQLVTPPAARGQVRAARKPQPCLGPGPPSPPLAHSQPAAREKPPGPDRETSLKLLGGKLRHRNTKGQTYSGTWN